MCVPVAYNPTALQAARARVERELRKRDLAEARGRTQGRGRDVLDKFADDDDDEDDGRCP